jgi:cytochrome P450
MGTVREQLRFARKSRLEGLLKFNRERGDIGRIRFVFGSVVLVNAPDLVHDVLVTRAKSFEKSPIMRAALNPLVGQGLFTSEGELWRRQRKLMAPMFQHGKIARFAEDMTACAEREAATWQDGEVLDVARATTRITMAVAGKTLFGIDTFDESDELGAALTVALAWAGEQASSAALIAQARLKIGLELVADRFGVGDRVKPLADRMLEPVLWPGPRTRALRRALDVLEARVARMIDERRADPGARHDLLSLLLEARGEEGEAMSPKQVRDEVLTLFVAGHETTAAALGWALMLLCQHRDVYGALRSEVDALAGPPAMNDLPKLGLALRVFKESMRLYPPVFMFGRVAVEDVDIGGYHIPRGTVVLVSPFALHRKPEIWPDPHRFDPSRFLPEAEAARHKAAFIPFSLGPRTCIGNHFALMEGPLVLATLLRRADFELVDPRGAEPEALATLRPRGGIPVRVRLRVKSA